MTSLDLNDQGVCVNSDGSKIRQIGEKFRKIYQRFRQKRRLVKNPTIPTRIFKSGGGECNIPNLLPPSVTSLEASISLEFLACHPGSGTIYYLLKSFIFLVYDSLLLQELSYAAIFCLVFFADFLLCKTWIHALKGGTEKGNLVFSITGP